MADPPCDFDAADDPATGRDRGSSTGTPPWVKVFGLIALVVVLLLVVLALTGRGNHGPGRHAPSGDAGHQPPSSTVGGAGGLGGPTRPTYARTQPRA